MAEYLLVGRNFVSGICKLKTVKTRKLKNLKPNFFCKSKGQLLVLVLSLAVRLTLRYTVLFVLVILSK